MQVLRPSCTITSLPVSRVLVPAPALHLRCNQVKPQSWSLNISPLRTQPTRQLCVSAAQIAEESPSPSPLNIVTDFVGKHRIGAAVALAATIALVMVWPAAAAHSQTLASFSLSDFMMEKAVSILGKVSQLNVVAKIVLVMASTLPAVVAFGALYSAITSVAMKDACVKMYVLLNKLPGMAVLNEKSVPATILVNVAFIAGTFIFAVLLGIVTEEVKTLFKNFRNGKFALTESGHVVVLNWNQQTVPLLRQIAAARKAGERGIFSQPVAILAEVPKTTMDSNLSAKLKSLNVDVVTRCGSPSVPADLESIAAAQAAAIIVMIPEKQDEMAAAGQLAQTAVSLAAACPRLSQQNIVFQAPQQHVGVADNMAAFKRLAHLGHKAQIMEYSDAELVQRMLTVSATQPQMQKIMSELVGRGLMRVVSTPPSLVGCTYQHARRMFADGVLVGVMRGDQPDMLVKEAYTLSANEELIMIAPSAAPVPINIAAEPVFLKAAEAVRARVKSAPEYKHTPRHIICVLADSSDNAVAELVTTYAELCPARSSVTFLSPNPVSGPSRKGNCSFKYLAGSDGISCSRALLKEAGIHSCTAVVVDGLKHMSIDAHDAFVTSTLLQVQDSISSVKRHDSPHFVAHIRKAVTAKSINAFLNLMRKEVAASGKSADWVINKPDLFHSDDFCGGILAHTAKAPSFSHLVSDLLDKEGAEVYIRGPMAFNLRIGDLLTFADVAETARAYDETAIGIIRSDDSLILAPEPTYPINLQRNDRIVVIAKDYDMVKSKHV